MYIYVNISLSSSWNKKYFGQSCRENHNTYFVFSNFKKKKNLTFIMWKNKLETDRQAIDDNKIRLMGFAYYITKTTDTHSECVIFMAFRRQQWLL